MNRASARRHVIDHVSARDHDINRRSRSEAIAGWFLRIALAATLLSALGWLATIAEIVIAVGLLIGWKLRWFSLAAGILLLSFALTMTVALGIKPPLDYSVFVDAAAAFLLAAMARRDSRASTPALQPN